MVRVNCPGVAGMGWAVSWQKAVILPGMMSKSTLRSACTAPKDLEMPRRASSGSSAGPGAPATPRSAVVVTGAGDGTDRCRSPGQLIPYFVQSAA